jgi:5-methylcytosine-specific restriction enzyme A
MMRRTNEMWIVGYFLSRFGTRIDGKAPSPPSKLQVKEWNRAYAIFYRSLGDGRTLGSFANSLKNARDSFDAHVSSGRVGWRRDGETREPAQLPNSAAKIIRQWGDRSEGEIWTLVAKYADMATAEVSDEVLSDLFAEIEPDTLRVQVRTEGGRRAVVTTRIERDPSLRNAAIRLYGCRCQVCGFSFEDTYGQWGRGFAVVHHLRMLADNSASERETDPQRDLAVLCANCHCMVHRRRHVVLTLEELTEKIRRSPNR